MGKVNRLYQYLATYTGLLSILTDGMHYAWPSPSLPQLTSQNNSTSFQLTNDEGSWVIIMQLIASIPSCFFGAVIMDIIGHKKTILATALPYCAAWITIAYADSFITLCVARMLAGLAGGIGFTVLPLYIGEIADPEIRGALGASSSIFWILGMLLINVIGSYLSITTTALISAVVPFFFIITFFRMPESPYYLIKKNRYDEARIALKILKGRSDVEDELDRLKKAISIQTENGKCLDLFARRTNQKALAIIAILRNSQQLSGVAAISFYTLSIFKEAGDFISPLTATIIYVSIQCVMAGVCSAVIDKTGRKPLLIVSLVGSSVSLFILGTYFYVKDFTEIDISSFTFVPLMALIGYVIIFNFGTQPIPLLMQGELFPTNVKAFASCISEMYFCITASVVSKFFQVMRDEFGMYLPFYAFVICCLINLVFVVFFVPETKGKTLEDIQDSLQLKKKKLNV